MRRLALLIFALVFTLAQTAQAITRETRDCSILLEEVDENTLLVIDVDNTLVLPDQYLGTTKWGWKYVDKLKEEGFKHSEAIDRTNVLLKQIWQRSGCHLVEARLTEILSKIQDKGIAVVGISSRPPMMGFVTSDQLIHCGVNLMRTTPVQEDFVILGQEDCRHVEGVILVGEMEDKGEALISFLRMSHLRPERIVFVDDRERNIRDARTAVQRFDGNVEFVGIWYREAEKWLNGYNRKLADVQLKNFGKILSNEDAQKLLKAGITR